MKQTKKMKKAANSFFYILAMIFMLFGCSAPEAENPSFPTLSRDAVTNFDAFWYGVSDNYMFFPYHTLNWDDVYTQYRPKITASMSETDLRNVILEIMNKLIDGHKALVIEDESYGVFTEEYINKHPLVLTDSIVTANYIDTSIIIRYAFQENSSFFQEGYLSRMKNNKSIAYFRYYTFRNAFEFAEQNDNLKENLNILQRSSSYNGLILDLRQNGGGDAIAFKNLVAKFVQGSYNWGFSKFRLSRDRYDATPFISEVIDADVKDNVYFTKPLVILTDRYSFSAAEVTALALRNLPNVVIIGDTTGGAQGPISPNKDYTGNFKMPNGWVVQLAQKATFDKNKNIFEGQGLPPDIYVKPSPTAAAEGRDNVLDRAVEYIR